MVRLIILLIVGALWAWCSLRDGQAYMIDTKGSWAVQIATRLPELDLLCEPLKPGQPPTAVPNVYNPERRL